MGGGGDVLYLNEAHKLAKAAQSKVICLTEISHLYSNTSYLHILLKFAFLTVLTLKTNKMLSFPFISSLSVLSKH